MFERKAENMLSLDELPALLRELAANFEDEEKAVQNGLKDFAKLKLSLKNEGGMVSLKLKVKPQRPSFAESGAVSSPSGASGKPRYKDLKKRMKYDFKNLLRQVHAGTLPSPEVLEAFLADSELMVSYPGKGDEFYAEYSACCAELAKASQSGDVAACKAALMELARQKSRCHALYD